jgi:glycosyltransferase involved in cell wall biosynthesis
MRTNPKISVLVPMFNGERYIEEALLSILNQDYKPLEIIVVDDGSIDKSAQIVKQFSSVRYVYQDNKGPVCSRNRALLLATGQYISFLDSDDIMVSGFLFKCADFLNKNKNVAIVEGRFQHLFQVNESSRFITKSTPYYHCFLGTSLYRKTVFDVVGAFDERLTFGDDADWFIRAWEKNVKKERLDITAIFYRKHQSNLTNNVKLKNQEKTLLFKLKIQRQYNRAKIMSTEGLLKDYLGDSNANYFN